MKFNIFMIIKVIDSKQTQPSVFTVKKLMTESQEELEVKCRLSTDFGVKILRLADKYNYSVVTSEGTYKPSELLKIYDKPWGCICSCSCTIDFFLDATETISFKASNSSKVLWIGYSISKESISPLLKLIKENFHIDVEFKDEFHITTHYGEECKGEGGEGIGNLPNAKIQVKQIYATEDFNLIAASVNVEPWVGHNEFPHITLRAVSPFAPVDSSELIRVATRT